MRCVLVRAAVLAAIVSSVCLISCGTAFASRDYNGNCGASGCHGVTSGREDTNPKSVTAQPGDTVTFTSSVTGPGNTSYVVFSGKVTSGELTESLAAVSGTANAAHKLVVTPSVSGWTQQMGDSGAGNTVYYNAARSTAASYTKDFSFVIPAGTPADTYQLRMGVGGNSSGQWAEFTTLNVTVGAVPEPATLAMILSGALVGFVCWRGRKYVKAE